MHCIPGAVADNCCSDSAISSSVTACSTSGVEEPLPSHPGVIWPRTVVHGRSAVTQQQYLPIAQAVTKTVSVL